MKIDGLLYHFREMKHQQKISPFQEWLSSQHSGLNIWFYQNVARRVSLVEQELFTPPKHMSSPPVFSGVHVTRSLVLYVCFVDLCLSFCTISFGHCIVCSSSIYGFWLLLWYLQSLLTIKSTNVFYLFLSKVSCHFS